MREWFLDRYRGRRGLLGWFVFRADVRWLRHLVRTTRAGVLMLCVASGASAQTVPPDSYPAEGSQRDADRQLARVRAELAQEKLDRKIDMAMWTFVGAAAADWTVSAVCIKVRCESAGNGHRTSFFMGSGFEEPEVATVVGLGVDVAFVWAIRTYVAPDHPELAQFLYYVGAGLRGSFAIIKARDLRRNTIRTVPR
jgi:hypothetical protein